MGKTIEYDFDRMIEVAEQNVQIFKAEYQNAVKRLDEVYMMRDESERKKRERKAAKMEVINDGDKDGSDN